jgi:glycosyltransferase involved in cell wall biosynthesis
LSAKINKPEVSIVLPVFNGEEFLSDSIDSVLDQSFENFELIIVNDGSTDQSKDIIFSKKDKRVVYLENKKNQGITRSLNRGFYYAIGEYIARMDSDDISLPKRIETQLKYFKSNTSVDILATNIVQKSKGVYNSFLANHEFHKIHLLKFNTIAHPTVMLKKSSLRAVNIFYDKDFKYAEDYKLWIDAMINGLVIETLGEPLLIFNDNNINNTTHSNFDEMTQNANCIKFLYAQFYFGDFLIEKMQQYFWMLNGTVQSDRKRNFEVIQLGVDLIKMNSKQSFFDNPLFTDMINNLISPFSRYS